MDNYGKIELFNKLKEELEQAYGGFDTIELVDEYTDDMLVESHNGVHYYDTGGCEEHTPYCIAVKRGD